MREPALPLADAPPPDDGVLPPLLLLPVRSPIAADPALPMRLLSCRVALVTLLPTETVCPIALTASLGPARECPPCPLAMPSTAAGMLKMMTT